MTDTLRIRLLGDFQIDYGGTLLTSVNSARLQSLLAYLLLHRGTPQSRAHAAFQFWTDSSEAQAQSNLRYFLHQLRRALPDAALYIQSDKTTLQWRADAPCTLDVAEFEGALSEAETAKPSDAARALEQALALYRGDLLPSCYDDWIVPERERLRDLFVRALERFSDLLEERGDYAAAIACTQRLLRHDPLREATYRHLMRLHASNGDPVDIARTYQTCAAVLERELSVEPSAATREEYERLVRQETRAAPAAPVPVKSERPPARLPIRLTSFVGRERELGEIRERLQSTRLLTLTGAGGCGKTRLALKVAADLSDSRAFSDGVCWVELAALADAALVPKAVASALGIAEQTERTLIESLCEALRSQQLLLVLDNCEHLIATCAQLVRTLASAAPRVHILVTSREALNLAGETTWVLLPLALPRPEAESEQDADLRTIAQAEAVQLFVERAGSTLPTFQLTQRNARAVAHICRRLDGIPLAIELAAARVKVLSVEQIADRLDDRFDLLSAGHRDALPRHQSLRAAIDWSYQLLSESERLLLQRLAVFAGGCTLEAAEAVCAFDGQPEVLNGLALLVDKSLLEHTLAEGEPRFGMLETIRAYARERLVQPEDAMSLSRAHATYYRDLAVKAEPHFFGAELETWLNRLDRERDNIRAALEWSKFAFDHGSDGAAEDLQIGLYLAAALWRFWELRGYITEGRVRLDALLIRSGDLRSYEKAYALHTAGNLAYAQGDLSRAKELFQECLSLSVGLQNWQFVAHMNNNLANIAFDQGEYERAAALYSEALDHYREVGWTWGVSMEFLHLGTVAHAEGKYERARSLYEESLALYRKAGDKQRIALVLNTLGLLADDLAQYDEATGLFREALNLYEQVGDPVGVPNARHNLGKMARRQGDLTRATALFEESRAQFQEMGDKRGIALALCSLGHIAQANGEYARATKLYGESLSQFRNVGERRATLDCLEGFATLNGVQGDYECAVRLFGAADALRQAIHTSLPPSERESHERNVNDARAALGDREFAAAWSAGQAMTLEQAVDYAQATASPDRAQAPRQRAS